MIGTHYVPNILDILLTKSIDSPLIVFKEQRTYESRAHITSKSKKVHTASARQPVKRAKSKQECGQCINLNIRKRKVHIRSALGRVKHAKSKRSGVNI